MSSGKPLAPTAPATARGRKRTYPTAGSGTLVRSSSNHSSASATPRIGSAALSHIPRTGAGGSATSRGAFSANPLVPLDHPAGLRSHNSASSGRPPPLPQQRSRKQFVPMDEAAEPQQIGIGKKSLPSRPATGGAASHMSTEETNRQLLMDFFEGSQPIVNNSDARTGSAAASAMGADHIFPHTLEFLVGNHRNKKPARPATGSAAEEDAGTSALVTSTPQVSVGRDRDPIAATIIKPSLSCNADNDNLLIRRIVEAHRSRRLMGGQDPEAVGSSSGNAVNMAQIASTFFMDSVMDVSRLNETTLGGTIGGATKDTGIAQSGRRPATGPYNAAPKLSKIPMRHWVLREGPLRDLDMSDTRINDEYAHDERLYKRLVFPSSSPGGRPEVYFLAQTLDLMCDEISGFDTLFDAGLAFALPVAGEGSPSSTQWFTDAATKYTSTGAELVKVLDVALSEVARQVAVSCVERAALIDRCRMVITDFAATCMDVVDYCKTTAAATVDVQNELKVESTKKEDELQELGALVLQLQETVAQQSEELETLRSKLTVYENQQERENLRTTMENRSSARTFSVQTLTQSADHMVEASVLDSGGGSAKMAKPKGEGGAADAVETASNASADSAIPEDMNEAYERSVRRNKVEEELYQESLLFLKALNEAVTATDAACGPFYDQTLFKRPSLNTTIARNKWIDIAKAVGKHEVLVEKRELMMRKLDNQRTGTNRSLGSAKRSTRSFKTEGVKSTIGASAALSTSFGSDTEHDDLHRELAQIDTEEAFLNPTLDLPPKYGVKPADLQQLLRDTNATIKEITMRLHALSESETLTRIAQPPMMPPMNPDEKCPLCERVDLVGAEKKRRHEAVAKITKTAQQTQSSLERIIKQQKVDIEAYQKQVLKLQKAQKDLETRLMEAHLGGGHNAAHAAPTRGGTTSPNSSDRIRGATSPVLPLNPAGMEVFPAALANAVTTPTNAAALDVNSPNSPPKVAATPAKPPKTEEEKPPSPEPTITVSKEDTIAPSAHSDVTDLPAIEIPMIGVTGPHDDAASTSPPPVVQKEEKKALDTPRQHLPRRNTAKPSDKPDMIGKTSSSGPVSPLVGDVPQFVSITTTAPEATAKPMPGDAAPSRAKSPPLVLNLVINCSCKTKGTPKDSDESSPSRRRKSSARRTSTVTKPTASSTAQSTASASSNNLVRKTGSLTSFPTSRSNSLESQTSNVTPALPALTFDPASSLRRVQRGSTGSLLSNQAEVKSLVAEGSSANAVSVDSLDSDVKPAFPDVAVGAPNQWAHLAKRFSCLTFGVPDKKDNDAVKVTNDSFDGEEDLLLEEAPWESEALQEQQAITSHLEAIVESSAPVGSRNPPVKPTRWALQLISSYMAGKLDEDLVRTHDGKPIHSCHEYLNVFLRQKYGAQQLVRSAALQLIAVLHRHQVESKLHDPRIMLFSRFVCNVYSEKTLNFYLRLGRVVNEAAYGPEYDASTAAADDHATHHARISCMRVVFVVDAVLARKPYRTALLDLCWEVATQVTDEAEYKEAMLRGVHHSCKTPVQLVPKSWTDSQKALSRMVLSRGTFLAMATHFEAAFSGEGIDHNHPAEGEE